MRWTAFLAAACLLGQQPQNPSPMVEHARAHPRLQEESPAGRREKLELGNLFVPARLRDKRSAALLVFFHGGTWVPEVGAARHGKTAVITIQIGAGSAVYARAFSDPRRLLRLVQEAESKSGMRFSLLALGGWSAGCAAVREILRFPEAYARVERVLLIDGIHTGYVDGKPGPLESRLQPENLEIFLQLAADAAAGKKRVLLTHSEIFPGTYASTTETADYLLARLGLRRRAVLRWGPMGMQQLSEARRGQFLLLGFAGNSAPDHVDQLHSLPELLKRLL